MRQQKTIDDLNSTARLQTEMYTEENYQEAFIKILEAGVYPEATQMYEDNSK